jgi:hypothetical protein
MKDLRNQFSQKEHRAQQEQQEKEQQDLEVRMMAKSLPKRETISNPNSMSKMWPWKSCSRNFPSYYRLLIWQWKITRKPTR